MDKVTLKTIKPGSTIKIEVGEGFYSRFQKLFFWVTGKDQERAVKTIHALKDREPIDEFENHLVTMLSLIYEIEAKAEDQDCLEEKSFPVPDKVNSEK